MNLNKSDNSAAGPDSGHLVDLKTQEHHPLSQEAYNLPSVPFDPEWVSPFTLPPLPALRKNRGQRNLLRSPEERLHQRTSSSAFYAAAWGSPYATPSPYKSSPQERLKRRSQDLGTASPLSAKVKEFAPERTSLQESSLVSNLELSATFSARKRASSWDRSKSLSERFNWLSESDLSGSEAEIRAQRTPTRNTYLKSLKDSVDKVKLPRSRSHQVQESTATITPETFNAASDEVAYRKDNEQSVQATMEQDLEEPVARPSSGGIDKPLPSLPLSTNAEKRAEIAPSTASPDSPSRPRMQSLQSFLRPKRKVPWKGKTCIIALPLTDRESAGLPPVLSSHEIKQRMQKWVAEGFDVDELSIAGPLDRAARFGQSRSLYPDPQDMYAERRNGKLHVHIPDQDEWEAWVEYLKEEKLRALGVTPSDSEAPMSVQSPFSSTMSRVSSTYPGLAVSPPINTLSANGNSVRIASNTFSPPLSHQGSIKSHGGSHAASPSISGYPGPMHGYKQSIAQTRMTSPYEYPVSHPGSFGPGMRNNSSGYGMRQFSPPATASLQSLGQVLSPLISTIPSNDNNSGVARNPTMEQIRQQQQRQQQLHQHMMQHQRQYSYVPPPQSRSAEQLPRTPILESPSCHTPEIMHPTPRSHRHNLSAALQKGVDDAEAAFSDHRSAAEEGNQRVKADADKKRVAENVPEDDQEPELPVLKRPETMADTDDKSEIETNPSIAASPMLMDDKIPFAEPFVDLQQIKDALEPQSNHKPKPSMSKLNVEAPSFDPQGRFSSDNFSFAGQSFQPAAISTTKQLGGGSRPLFTTRKSSISKFNVEAPAFTPSLVLQSPPMKEPIQLQDTPNKQTAATPSKSPFSFSSPSFNVEAPEFKPGESFSFTARNKSLSQADQTSLTSAGSIFGSVTIDPNSKVNRRGKVPPVVHHRSSEGEEQESTDDDDDDDDDDEGRPSAPSDRQKRVRRIGGDDDEELLFAKSAPFNHADGLSSKREGATQEISKDNFAPSNVQDASVEHAEHEPILSFDKGKDLTAEVKPGASPAKLKDEQPGADLVTPSNEQEENKPKYEPEVTASEVEDPIPSSGSDMIEILEEPSTAEDDVGEPAPMAVSSLADATLDTVEKIDTAAPVARNAIPADDSAAEENKGLQINQPQTEEQTEPTTATSENDHKPTFSLSALAKPFEFHPSEATSFVPEKPPVTQPVAEPKKVPGLMASRFATASPQSEHPVMFSRKDSPPHELYKHIKPEDADANKPTSSREPSRSSTPSPGMPNVQFEATPQLTGSIERSMGSEAHLRAASRSPSEGSRIEESMPSLEEIDAVMKQFQNNPDLGVEREDTPVKSTPLIDMRLAPVFRSDAPSPSPRRTVLGPQRRADWGLGIHRLNDGNDEISDWNHEFSPRQEDKLQSQAQYFDSHVNNLVGSILENRLVPLEETLHTIQSSLATLIDRKPRSSGRRSMSTDNKDSDADDEETYDAFEGFPAYRSHSPSRNQRKADKIRAIVTDAIVAYQPPVTEQPVLDTSEINAALAEIRKLSQHLTQAPPAEQKPDIRSVMEDVISNHPQIKVLNRQDDLETVRETYRSKTDVLERFLKEAKERVDQEVALRRQADEDMNHLNHKLQEAQNLACMYREASEEAQSHRMAFVKEKEAHQELQSKYDDVLENNNALEDTLAEYRVTSDQFRDEIKLERARNQDLIRMMHNLREDFNDKLESRQALRNQMERLKEKMAQVMYDVHADEAEWRRKDHELVVQNKTIQAALDHEIRHREKIELELDSLDKEHKENMRFRSQHEHAQREISRLQQEVMKMNGEHKSHQDISFRLERELAYVKDSANNEVSKATARLQSELEAARATIESLQSDADAQISRLQKRLDDAELDLEEQKATHDTAMAEVLDVHTQALHEANQKRETALEEQHSSHERKLNDLRERHTRALHNSSDDRHRLEHQLNEKLAINEQHMKHLESQVKDLEERLEISKSAARAAVEAATAKVTNLPTPAPSVVASPPQRLSSASLQVVKGTDIPEKISPQAMRESIMVLQDQLQNRELAIEKLEAEIAALDKDAPEKIKERENEITLLRELLGVRVDDLTEIITTLSQTDYDREATKHAAIRLKANLQMEQQLKERAATNGSLTSSLPSAISNFAQSPRGLPLAAAAAWGNWRKARDFSLSAVSDIATNISQTPSKSTAGSPSSFLASIMTPPSTSQRTPPLSDTNPLSPPAMRPLATAAAARKNTGGATEARPLRTYSSQARTLSSRQPGKRRESNESTSSEATKRVMQHQPETPTTPIANRSLRCLDLGEDVDDDASPFDASEHEQHQLEDSYKEAVAS